MDSRGFDNLARILGKRLTRRDALTASAATLATIGLSSGAHAAQDATPVPESEGSVGPAFLFVQLAENGAWEPKPDEPGVYLLTLYGPSNQTVFFSDRPERIVGTVETDRFLGALGFSPYEPPNAAAVVQTPDGERDVLVIELFNPVYSRAYGEGAQDSLVYEAKVLAGYQGAGLAEWVPEMLDDQLPREFTQVSLFIDDCADLEGCYLGYESGLRGPHAYIGPIPGGPYGRCWNWGYLTCMPCKGLYYDQYDKMCNDTYPECRGNCQTNTCWLGIC